MASDHKNESEASTTLPFDISPEILLSLATGPLLLGILGGRALMEVVQEVSQLSEEIFRGDRLPTLNDPLPTATETTKSESI